MTILFLARRFYPHIGGVEKHVMEIGKRLVTKGHRVIVLTEATSNSLEQETINGIEIKRIFVGKEDKLKKFRIWRSMFALKNLIEEADVIHAHDVFFWYFPFRFLYPNKKVYTTFHGYESYPISQKAIFIRKVSEKLSKGNICIGDFIKKWYKTNPTYVSYGAVELPEIKKSDVTKKDSAVFIGRVTEQTGVLTYVKAFALIKKKFPKFDFVIVGDGDQKKLIPKGITVTGFKENPEKYFTNYHFAFVSRYLSILEAFAAKRVVIAVYDNPVKEDYLRLAPYAKFIIIEKTPERVVEKIEELLKNPTIETKMINEAYEWVKKQSWEEMVSLYLRLWKK